MANPEEGSGRKYRKLEKGVRSLSSLPWNDALGKLLDSGHSADVIFLVGPEEGRTKVPAHKLILSAKSEVFRAMLDERWNFEKSGENGVKIEIGSDINPLAFQQLIQFIYKDDVDVCLESLGFEDLFNIRDLAEMYGVSQLRDGAALKIALELVKDYRKCYLVLENDEEDKDLIGVAFAVLKRHLWEAMTSDDLLTKWTQDIWESVLTDEANYRQLDLCFIEEIDLFQKLCKWKDYDPVIREEAFEKLLKLIRFSLMSAGQLRNEVLPTGVLSRDELLDIFQLKLDATIPVPQNSRIQLSSERRRKTVFYATSCRTVNCYCSTDEEEHRRQLDDPIEIMLLPGEYFWDIIVARNYLKLTGFGPYTILKGCHSALKLPFNHIILENLTIQTTMFVLDVTGDDNLVKNIHTTSENKMFGLDVSGEDNTFENFYSQSLCASSSSDSCQFAAFCETLEVGFSPFPARFVWLRGRRNKISTFKCTFLFNTPTPVIPQRYQTKFKITGHDNKIEDVNIEEASRIFDESTSSRLSSLVSSIGVGLSVDANRAVVTRCSFFNLEVNGECHDFEKVVAVASTTVKGSRHKFKNCKFGVVIDDSKDSVKTECVTVPEWVWFKL